MEQQETFGKIRETFKKFVPPLSVMLDNNERFDLYSQKDVELFGRKYKEIYFGSVILKPKYTGFYFMPIYIFPELLNDIPEELKKLQTGKSCFHIKKYDQDVMKAVDKLIKAGFEMYKKKKYI